MKKYELLAVGGVYIDINSTGAPFDERGLAVETELVAGDYEFTLGGSALNFSRLCVALGLSAVMVGKTGQDRPGEMLARMIEQAGIRPALVVDAAVHTNIGMNFVNDQAHTLMAAMGTANQALTADEVLERAEPLLPEVEYLYLGSCLKLKRLLPAYEELAERARATDTRIVVDHGRLNAGSTEGDLAMVRELVRRADYYFPSRDEFLALWGFGAIEAGLEDHDWGDTRVAVKDGARGAWGLVGGNVVRVPAHDVRPVNMVGAGDSFNAGVIAAVRAGKDLETAMRYGSATAALKISRPGLPTLAEVERLVKAGA
ncbi:MAG TPA: carbohydrate kinase family protein [Candidatus Saccharimonadia bacterium]|nr:carbohydrate kinase family protein [Candidatus Saccharimonadia bacterium]